MSSPIPSPALHFTERKFCSRMEDSNYYLKPRYHAGVLSYFGVFHPHPLHTTSFHSILLRGRRPSKRECTLFCSQWSAISKWTLQKRSTKQSTRGWVCSQNSKTFRFEGENDSLCVHLL